MKNAVSGNEGLASWEKVHYYRGQQKEFLDAILEMCFSCDLECCFLPVRAMWSPHHLALVSGETTNKKAKLGANYKSCEGLVVAFIFFLLCLK